MSGERAVVSCLNLPTLKASSTVEAIDQVHTRRKSANTRLALSFTSNNPVVNGSGSGSFCNFACVSVAHKGPEKDLFPTSAQFLKHPLALVALVPKDISLFFAGAVAGAAAKTVNCSVRLYQASYAGIIEHDGYTPTR